MTAVVDIVNRALQLVGTRTNITAAELANNSSNEAIQANLVMFQLRDELNRMAPWSCVEKYASLAYISTTPGNPENPNSGAPLWQAGAQPAPPWNYEYQYPVDCLRARAIYPQFTTQAGGVPIYPVGTVTGAGQIGWTGPGLKFKISTDNLFGVTAATVVAGGSGYTVGDFIVLAQPTYTFRQNQAPAGQAPVFSTFTVNAGAPAVLQVLTIGGGGSVATVAVVNQIQGEATPIGGSYYSVPTNPVAQNYSFMDTNPGAASGSGATFNLTFGPQAPQRVILCNQTQAILLYNGQVTDPNLMDPLFQDAWINVLAARLVFQMSGDKAVANMQIGLANNMIMEARKADGNEGITVNDVTPDFLRVRGGYGVGPNFEFSPNVDFEWGATFSPY